MKRILTGIQPSGTLHIGNYFGAMRPILNRQGEGEIFFFLADLHALTSLRDPAALRANVREATADYLACGLDPERTVCWRQSDVPAHSELMWILSTLTPMRMLELAVSYKDKVEQGLVANAGLFTYPVLQAADILLYDADVVPVGRDQKQHLEMTRDIATKFNAAYGDTLKLPEPEISENVAVVPGLDGRKMSKSYGNALDIFQDEKPLRKRVMSIVTDSTPLEHPKPVEGSNILALYRLVASPEQVAGWKTTSAPAASATATSRSACSKRCGSTSPPCARAAPRSWRAPATWTRCWSMAPAAPATSPMPRWSG
jgi:tryptophanyl-tRNA synthetase